MLLNPSLRIKPVQIGQTDPTNTDVQAGILAIRNWWSVEGLKDLPFLLVLFQGS